MSEAAKMLPITHRSVLSVAVPIMLSNVTEPLIGVVNTAVIGHLPEPYYTGAIAVGALIFSFLFWGFGFLRLSTGGLSAQAVGAGNQVELAAVIYRALFIAVAVGLLLILMSPLISHLAFVVIGGSAEVQAEGRRYFSYRIWSAPFALINFCVLGWFIGQGQARFAFLVQVILNLTNMALSATFVMALGMTTNGVGLAAVLAEITGALVGLALVGRGLRKLAPKPAWAEVWNTSRILTTLAANGDIMIRTICLLFAFGWFTARGARAGDIVVAANAVLMNFFEMAAYFIDGFAYASEALVGQSVGARNPARFARAIRLTMLWAVVVGLLCSLLIRWAGPAMIDLMSTNPEVRRAARQYLPWASLTPLLGAVCFQFDGIFTGALATRDMRNMMLVSLAIFLASWWALETRFGNHGLWASLCIFLIARGTTFALRLPTVQKNAFR
jgi:MATE family multidrug resistance protein